MIFERDALKHILGKTEAYLRLNWACFNEFFKRSWDNFKTFGLLTITLIIWHYSDEQNYINTKFWFDYISIKEFEDTKVLYCKYFLYFNCVLCVHSSAESIIFILISSKNIRCDYLTLSYMAYKIPCVARGRGGASPPFKIFTTLCTYIN